MALLQISGFQDSSLHNLSLLEFYKTLPENINMPLILFNGNSTLFLQNHPILMLKYLLKKVAIFMDFISMVPPGILKINV